VRLSEIVFECCVCYQYLGEHIYSCSTAPHRHSVCHRCWERISTTSSIAARHRTSECPCCRSANFGGTRCTAMERLASTHPIRCAYSQSGCTVQLPSSHMEKHISEQCDYRPVLTMMLQGFESRGVYTGHVDANKLPHGNGSLVYSDTIRTYTGLWQHGRPRGHGVLVEDWSPEEPLSLENNGWWIHKPLGWEWESMIRAGHRNSGVQYSLRRRRTTKGTFSGQFMQGACVLDAQFEVCASVCVQHLDASVAHLPSPHEVSAASPSSPRSLRPCARYRIELKGTWTERGEYTGQYKERGWVECTEEHDQSNGSGARKVSWLPLYTYMGEMQAGLYHGYGKLTRHPMHGAFHDDWQVREGHWKHNLLHGRGTEVLLDGTSRSGNWSSNKLHGFGHIRHPNSSTCVVGEWTNGHQVNLRLTCSVVDECTFSGPNDLASPLPCSSNVSGVSGTQKRPHGENGACRHNPTGLSATRPNTNSKENTAADTRIKRRPV